MIIDSYIPLGTVDRDAMSTNVDPGATGPDTPGDEPFGLRHPTVVPTNFEPKSDPEDR
jgi:hypothetical protein